MSAVLQDWRAPSRARVRDQSSTWVADVAFKLAEDGHIGLEALYRSITRAEVRRCFAETTPSGEDFGQRARLMAWLLP